MNLPNRAWLRTAALLAGTAAVYAGLDTALFRTRLYLGLLEPSSYAGNVISGVRELKKRKTHPARDVLVAGDSRIAEGFSMKMADRRAPEYGWISAAQNGTGACTWYYLLREADPDANRFRAIVLPVERYEDFDDIYDPAVLPWDLRASAPLLRWVDVPTFVLSFPAEKRSEALRVALFRGMSFKQDVAEFLARPGERLNSVRFDEQTRASSDYDYPGVVRSVADVAVDWKARRVRVPAKFNPQFPDEAYNRGFEEFLFHDPWPQNGVVARYRRIWFGRILERYRHSATRMVFVQTPSWPWPREPRAGASTVMELARQFGATVLPAGPFLRLESPENFEDWLHLNAKGRALFTRALVDEIRKVL